MIHTQTQFVTGCFLHYHWQSRYGAVNCCGKLKAQEKVCILYHVHLESSNQRLGKAHWYDFHVQLQLMVWGLVKAGPIRAFPYEHT